MSERESVHPDAETFAAFVDGTLDEPTTNRVAAHVDACDACLIELADANAFAREEAKIVPMPSAASRRSYRAALAAAAVAILVIAGGAFYYVNSPARMIAQLADAAPRDQRTIEARISGFAYAPISRLRGGGDTESDRDLAVAGAAGAVLEKMQDRTSAGAQHAAGVAQLTIAANDDAVALLARAAAKSPNDAAIWSDLAAAHFEAARTGRNAAIARKHLEDARAAAEHALAIDAHYAPALFNEALILQDLRDPNALAAWQRYLANTPPGDPWRNEAESHIRGLSKA